MLSGAKHLQVARGRPFASLRVTVMVLLRLRKHFSAPSAMFAVHMSPHPVVKVTGSGTFV